MASLFENLGRRAGHAFAKGKSLVLSAIGDDDEARSAESLLGADLAAEMLRQIPRDDDDAVQRLVHDIGGALTARLTDRRLRFSFVVLAAEDANACALPGGYVFLNRGLLTLCANDRDEIAFVAAHEIAHVVLRHAMERILANSVITAMGRALPGRTAAAAWLRQTGMQLLVSAHSQDEETDADEFAVRILRAAGFDRNGGIRLLTRLRELGREPGGLGVYFASHPPADDRIERLSEAITGT